MEGALAGVPVTLPALTRALKLQAKASQVGFDWNDPRAVLRKIREEADEIEAALDRGDRRHAAAEVGDLCSPRSILRVICAPIRKPCCAQTNRKFERRFAAIERHWQHAARRRQDATLAEMDGLWDEAKAAE